MAAISSANASVMHLALQTKIDAHYFPTCIIYLDSQQTFFIIPLLSNTLYINWQRNTSKLYEYTITISGLLSYNVEVPFKVYSKLVNLS